MAIVPIPIPRSALRPFPLRLCQIGSGPRQVPFVGPKRWLCCYAYAFEAGRTDHAEELDSTATKLGRLAGRAFAELKKRAKEPRE
jgi:hypothetical protein